MPHPQAQLPTAAQKLQGLTLDGGWKVLQLLPRGLNATGGCFSEGYLVEDTNGRKAFLKALDFSGAPFQKDTARWLEIMLRAFNHEKDLLYLCEKKRLDRIVMALGDGQVLVPGGGGLNEVVPYLILECAQTSLRSQAALVQQFDRAMALRILHQVAVGLQQLHGIRIAHQDLKPSNVVLFGPLESRITDMGSASHRDRNSPQDELSHAGDGNYTPPELLYKVTNSEWHTRRFGCDAYMLGALVVFLFYGTPMTPLVLAQVPQHQKPRAWNGSYSDVFPLVQAGFGDALTKISQVFQAQGVPELTEVVRQLCDPDPSKRGHPKDLGRGQAQYDLTRYVSFFDRLARRMEIGFWKPA